MAGKDLDAARAALREANARVASAQRTADSRRASSCYGTCAKAWPPFLTKSVPRALRGADRAKLGTVKRRNGTTQVTYAGHPLYYYVGDTKPGQILCQNVREYGGLWLVVSPSGKLVR